jgi:OOP family OmpA-OmpF porin
MKLNRIALAVLVTAPLSIAAHAEYTGLGLTLTPLVGYQWFDGKSRRADALGFQPQNDVLGAFAIGYELTPSLAIEAEYNDTRNSAKIPGVAARPDGSAHSIEGNFLLNSDFITGDYDGRFKPYVLVGAGQQKLKYDNAKSTDTIVNLGLGAFYRINEALAFRVEGRAVENTDNSLTDYKALTGLQVTLGGHKRPYVAPAPVEVPPAPMPAPEPAPVVVVPPAPAQLTEDLKLELRVFFDTNKSIIKTQYQPEIAKVADKLKEFPNATAEIKGYTDSTGPRKLNDRLSQARAESVKTSLASDYGIDAGRLTAKGYSWDDPVASNKTKEGRALNRRVVAVIIGSRTVTQ